MNKKVALIVIIISLLILNPILYGKEYIAYLTQTSTSENIITNINKFKENINKEKLINTNKFFCSGSLSCASVSDVSYLGLISEAEYNYFKTGTTEEPFFVITNQYFIYSSSSTTYKKLTSSGISDNATTSGIKVSAYLQSDVEVAGEGTYNNPYVIQERLHE